MHGNVPGIGKLSGMLQPVYEITRRGRELWGVEGLVRGPKGSPLEHPTRLFAHAARLGILAQVDRAALEAVLECASIAPGKPRIEVNVHATTLCGDAGFDRFLTSVAWGFSIPMSRLVVDVLEASEVAPADLAAAFGRLKQVGVTVALDEDGLLVPDFGLLLIARPDLVKVSSTLVHRARGETSDRDMLRALVGLGVSLGFRVTAEGVETLADCRCMSLLGLELMQGYHFAHPVTAGAWRRGDSTGRDNVWDALSA